MGLWRAGPLCVAGHQPLIAVASLVACGAQVLGTRASVAATCRLQGVCALVVGAQLLISCVVGPGVYRLQQLCVCGPSCSVACGIFPDVKPMLPALAGGFLCMLPQGKSA